ncbi:MAG TPA: ATP-binding protein, partial [Dermatophilaceae bacterium]
MKTASALGEGYGADDIVHLRGLDAVRKRPGMYVGSTDSRGINHLVSEILDNSVDEAVAGFCSRIDVTLHPDGSLEVTDDGRGIPVGMNTKAQRSALELVLSELHAGGKFSSKTYNTSGGLHGVGAAVVNALSLRLDAAVRRDGKVHEVSFRHGVAGVFGGPGPQAKFTP